MTLTFNIENDELLMCYTPTYGADEIIALLNKNEEVTIKNTFHITSKTLRKIDYEFEIQIYFAIGKIKSNYILLDSKVFMLKNNFFISTDITLKQNMFVAFRNISIMNKIDQVVNDDVYIGGEWEKVNGVSYETFAEFIKKFPNSTELTKYSHRRIAIILKEYFPQCEKYEAIYDKYMNKKEIVKTEDISKDTYLKIEIEQFSIALNDLKKMIENFEGVNEIIWQEKIRKILRILYPKYILFKREFTFKGVDNYDKRPDFILVDVNGFIDILEIKKPDVRILTKQASYRNNYVPVREFSGAIQQIEKYIHCLSTIKNDEILHKLSKELPPAILPQVVNPQGILLMGRSFDFNKQQRMDFELIKRQYKNVVDIMTYDDLITRLDNIIVALKSQL